MKTDVREPLSWLTLELYALGELDPELRRRVEEQLAASQTDRARLARIESERVELLPLPRVLPARSRKSVRLWLSAAGGALALAAAALFAWLPQSGLHRAPGSIKGGELAIELVGEWHGVQASQFAEGERFRLRVSCATELSHRLRAAIYQGGQRYEPLAAGGPETCGNHVTWPGAFRLTGAEPVTVCVRWDEASWPALPPLGDESVRCTSLSAQDRR